MTFEDFKKQFEMFSKIDTAEKLAFCESQYKKHLLHIEEEEYFEPTENRLGDDITSQYEKNLSKILCFDTINANQIYFLVKPSFEPEHLLILEKLQDRFLITLTTLTKNYWTVFCADNNIIDIEKRIVTAELSTATGNKLFNILDKAIIQARQPKSDRFVLDGVIYSLSKPSDGEQKIVSKHSPSSTSKSGRIIEIMQQLIDSIRDLDNNIALDIEAKISTIQT